MVIKIIKKKDGTRYVVDKDGTRYRIQSENSDEELVENLAELVKQLKLKKRRNKKRAAKKKLTVDNTPIMTVSAASNIDKLRIEQLQKSLDIATKNNAPLAIRDNIRGDLEMAKDKLKTLIAPEHYLLVNYLINNKELVGEVYPELKNQPIEFILSNITPVQAEKLKDEIMKKEAEDIIEVPFTAPPEEIKEPQYLPPVEEGSVVRNTIEAGIFPDAEIPKPESPADQSWFIDDQSQDPNKTFSSLFVEGDTGNGCDCADNGDEKGLNGIQINEMLKSLAPVYKGTVSVDRINQIKKDRPLIAFIANTAPSSEPGRHWISAIIGPTAIEYYDSFGTPPSNRILKQIKELSGDTPKQLKINKVKMQGTDSTNCGWFCIKFLLDRLFHGKTFKEATGWNIIEDYVSSAGEEMIEDFKEKMLADQFGDL